MSEEELYELAFKDTTELLTEDKNVLLDIIEVLHQDRRRWLMQYAKTHNEGVDIQQERNNYKELYEKEKGKVEMYENPADLTLFYMWLDTKAKDKMKRLNDNWNKLKNKLIDLFNRSQDICYINVLEIMQEIERL